MYYVCVCYTSRASFALPRHVIALGATCSIILSLTLCLRNSIAILIGDISAMPARAREFANLSLLVDRSRADFAANGADETNEATR